MPSPTTELETPIEDLEHTGSHSDSGQEARQLEEGQGILDIQEHARELGLSPEQTAEAIKDYMDESEKDPNQEDPTEETDDTTEEVDEPTDLESLAANVDSEGGAEALLDRFDRIEKNLQEVAEGLKEIQESLGEVMEMLSKLIEALIKLIEDLLKYLKRVEEKVQEIARAEDPEEKLALKDEIEEMTKEFNKHIEKLFGDI